MNGNENRYLGEEPVGSKLVGLLIFLLIYYQLLDIIILQTTNKHIHIAC